MLSRVSPQISGWIAIPHFVGKLQAFIPLSIEFLQFQSFYILFAQAARVQEALFWGSKG